MITVDEIKNLLTQREDYYQTLHEEQRRDNGYYELTFNAGIPTALGYPQRTPPTARRWVDVGVQNYTLDNPKGRMLPRGNSDAGRKKDAACEAFINFWLDRLILSVKESAKKLLLRGEVFIKVGMDDTYFGHDISRMTDVERGLFDEKRLYHFPLLASIPDPMNVYCSPAHDGLVPVDVIESYDMTMAEALNLCYKNGWDWTSDKPDAKTVTWISYISADERCFILGGEPVLSPPVQPNFFKFCPYVHIPSGYGQSSYEGKPEAIYRGIIFPRRHMLKLEARALSAMDAINTRYAYDKAKIKGEDADVTLLYPDGTIDLFNPMEFIRENDRVTVEILQGSSPPPGLMEELAYLGALAAPSAVLSGQRPTGVYSGALQDRLIAQSKPDYKDPFKNLEAGLGVFIGMGLKVINEVYGHPVAIRDVSLEGHKRYKQITPGDIDGHYDCEIELLAEPPEATDLRKTLGNNEQKSGVISHLYNLVHYHDMSQEEAMNEIAQIIAEQAMREPGMRDFVAMDAMKLLGMEEEADALMETRKGAAGGLPPRRTPETVPTGMEGMGKTGQEAGMEAMPSAGELETGAIPMER